MTAFPTFPVLDSAAKCAALWSKYPEKVVGMWATGLPHQNVDVLWRLREELLLMDVPVVFFFDDSAKPMLSIMLSQAALSCNEHIYQLDDPKYFCLLNFVDVLVASDGHVNYSRSRYIDAKLVGLPHHAKIANPFFWNCFYDYVISDVERLSNFDYSIFPNYFKVHKNQYFTQLIAGHPKIDLIKEERDKATLFTNQPILLIYPSNIDAHINLQKINYSTYEEIWTKIIAFFLKFHTTGIVILSPPLQDRHHPIIERISSTFTEDGRVFVDSINDNKFWMARATYFITDYSKGFINFCMTARIPAIRMIYTRKTESPRRDDWGWHISRPDQFVPVLKEIDRDRIIWDKLLLEKQECEMPTLGKNFLLLAGMIKRIFKNEDDPTWIKLNKGNTPCRTSRDMLKMVVKITKFSNYSLRILDSWLWTINHFNLAPTNSKIWLLLLKRALLAECDRDSMDDIYQLKIREETPASISTYIDIWMDKALNNQQLPQLIGLLRHLISKDSHKITVSLLMTITSNVVLGPRKKRALFFLLMELPNYDKDALLEVNELAEAMPQHFSRPVLDKLNRFLPLAMKVPLPLRRFASGILGMKKPLAKKYWKAHQELA